MVASSSGSTSGRKLFSSRSCSSSAIACSISSSIGRVRIGRSGQRPAIRLARGASAMSSLGSVRSSACSISSRFPPAVEQCRDRARLQDRHVGDDPRRAVAHRDADSVALGDPARGEPMSDAFGNAVELGEGQPFVARDHGFDFAVQRAECAEQVRDRRREIGDDGAALLVAADRQPPAGSGDPWPDPHRICGRARFACRSRPTPLPLRLPAL